MTTNQRIAPITGVTGQDGSYLAEFLLEKGQNTFAARAQVLLSHQYKRMAIYMDFC